jgi:hypothetical protein
VEDETYILPPGAPLQGKGKGIVSASVSGQPSRKKNPVMRMRTTLMMRRKPLMWKKSILKAVLTWRSLFFTAPKSRMEGKDQLQGQDRGRKGEEKRKPLGLLIKNLVLTTSFTPHSSRTFMSL